MSKPASIFLLLLCILLGSVACYSWWLSLQVPSINELAAIEGIVDKVDFTSGRYGINGLRFWLTDSDQRYFYPKFLGNFQEVQKHVIPGSSAYLLVEKGDDPHIWYLSINDNSLATFQQIERGRKINGNFALAIAFFSFISCVIVIRKYLVNQLL